MIENRSLSPNAAFFAEALDMLESGTPLVHVCLVDKAGSTPRGVGATMLVFPDGSIRGTVGGGRCEVEAIRESLLLLQNAAPSEDAPSLLLRYALNDANDMVCGGNVFLLLEPLLPVQDTLVVFREAKELVTRRTPFFFRLQLDFDALKPSGSDKRKGAVRRYIYPCRGASMVSAADSSTFPATITVQEKGLSSESPADVFRKEPSKAEFFDADDFKAETFRRWVVLPYVPPSRVFLFGAGHVARAVAAMAHLAGFSCVVADDRKEFLEKDRFPHAKTVHVAGFSEADNDAFFGNNTLTLYDAIVIATRDHAGDKNVLASALRTGAGYIGMLGSLAKQREIYRSLEQEGVSADRLLRVRCPVGIPIGAQTPEEIAVSITAELVQWIREQR